ncbi:MAG: hypothetical protein K8I03_01265 [Ignavibacteria bacterium]|nr:hypothetical protein [Ignavibacteria bacterium]
MKNSKLITLLKTFSKEEMRSFGKFIDSPYFTSGRNLKPLFTILKRHHPKFESSQLSDRRILTKLNPEEEFDKNKSAVYLRVLFSEMTKIARDFMATEVYLSNERNYERRMDLCAALRNKWLTGEALKVLDETKKILDAENKAENYYYRQIFLNWTIMSALKEKDNQLSAHEYEINNIFNIYACMFTFLKTTVNNLFVGKYRSNTRFRGFEMVESFIRSFDVEMFKRVFDDDEFESKNQVLYNYYLIKSRLDENDKESLLIPLELFYKFFDKVSHISKWNNFISLNNRFIGRSRMDRMYLIKANELIDFVLRNGLYDFDENVYVDLSIYATALRIKAYLLNAETLKKFINKYSGKVSPKYAPDIRIFSMAIYNFKIENFEKCLELTSKSDNFDVNYKINKYKLKMCSLFELGYYEEAHYAVLAFERFMNRKEKIGSLLKKDTLEFIEGMKKLIYYKTHEDRRKIDSESLRDLHKNTIFGDWFIKKAHDLK